MKKLITVAATLTLAAAITSAQSITLKNTFGGDEDNIYGDDFMSWSRKTDDASTTDKDEAEEFQSNEARTSDRLQLDVSSDKIDGRVRIEFKNIALNGKGADVRVRGFVRYTPVSQLQLAAGNEFFTKYGLSAGYLAAADDTPKYARMADSGVTVNGNLGGLKLLANLAGNSKVDDKNNLGLNFGFDWNIADTVKVGAAAKNVTGNNISIAAFAGLGSVKNLTLNAGYIYNATDTDFITKAAKNAVQASIGYNFEDAKLNLAADVIAALSSEYISGDDTLDYKNSSNDKGTPFAARFDAKWGCSENVTVDANVKLFTMFGWENSTKTIVYPSVSYKLPKKMGTLKTGVRMTFQDLKSDGGLQKVAIPFMWEWKAIDFKANK